MQIICPHCTTSYEVDPSKFGGAGRTVRCARCHQTWLARAPENAVAANTGFSEDDDWNVDPHGDNARPAFDEPPHVESPSIAADWVDGEEAFAEDFPDQPPARRATPEWLQSFLLPLQRVLEMPAIAQMRDRLPVVQLPKATLPIACASMAAISFALVIWRADVVRLMPQTGSFFRMIGLGVNLRGIEFSHLKLTTENVDGTPVLVIDGAMNNITRKASELPRLRFIVRDANGTDIYAWNSVLEKTSLGGGQRLAFRSRLASPPPEGREIVVRFFQRRDVANGGI